MFASVCVSAVPVITWCYKSVNLSRSSQPMSGLLNSRSEHDENLVLSLIPDEDGGGIVAGKDKRMYICDARPRINAITNKGKVRCWVWWAGTCVSRRR